MSDSYDSSGSLKPYNSDGTVRMICNDDRDGGWYAGRLYQIFPQNTYTPSTPSTIQPPALSVYNPGSSPVYYAPGCSASGGGGTSEGWEWPTAIAIALLMAVAVVIWYIVQSSQASVSSGYNYTSQVTNWGSAVTNTGCNIRARPSGHGRRIGTVPQGTSVQILQAGKWDRVRLPSGREGYIWDRLLAK